MLWFERQVVATLVSPTLDEHTRNSVESYVENTLRSMPEYLRAGVAAESLLFGAWPRINAVLGRLNSEDVTRRIERWQTSRIDPLRQYVRLLQSLVLFAENELAPEAEAV
jgi:hypothetical protein